MINRPGSGDLFVTVCFGVLCLLLALYLSFSTRFEPAFLGQHEGVIVFRATAATDLRLEVEHAGGPKFVIALKSRILGPVKSFPLKPGTHLYVNSLPAGNYTWSAMTNGRKRYDLPTTNRFVIEAGRLNYVGDIVLSNDENFQVDANTLMIVKDLGTAYPNLTTSLPLIEHITALR